MRISRAISHENSISHIMGCFSFSSLPFPSPPSSSLPPSFTPFLPLSVSLFLCRLLFLLFSPYLILSPLLSLIPLSPIFHSFLQDPKQLWSIHGEKAPTVYSKNKLLVKKSTHRSWKFLVAHQADEPFQHIWALLDTLTLSNGMGHTAAMAHQLVWLARPCQCHLEISSHPWVKHPDCSDPDTGIQWSSSDKPQKNVWVRYEAQNYSDMATAQMEGLGSNCRLFQG